MVKNRSMRKYFRYSGFLLFSFVILNYFGLFTHFFEEDYDSTFNYPLNEDIMQYVEQLKNHDRAERDPINSYNYTFIKSPVHKCKDARVRLLILVKSAVKNADRRAAIRRTFGFERRFSDVDIRTVFLLGVGGSNKEVDAEDGKYHDIIQANFTDTYFNNTIKTMTGFRWAVENCESKFYLFSDDDMYVSIKNVLRFIRNPARYPDYIEESLAALRKQADLYHMRLKRQAEDYDLPDDVVLFAGFMFNSSPHRHQSSKWYVSLDEYPWHMWPPYISAGAYILSKEALINMYYASFYTLHFRFDDIYLAILAKKCGIEPFHSKEFYFYKKDYNVQNYRYVIASHGFGNPRELTDVWDEQKSSGNA